jgi:hypothetical protein
MWQWDLKLFNVFTGFFIKTYETFYKVL